MTWQVTRGHCSLHKRKLAMIIVSLLNSKKNYLEYNGRTKNAPKNELEYKGRTSNKKGAGQKNFGPRIKGTPINLYFRVFIMPLHEPMFSDGMSKLIWEADLSCRPAGQTWYWSKYCKLCTMHAQCFAGWVVGPSCLLYTSPSPRD